MRHTTHTTHDVTDVTALAPERSEHMTRAGVARASEQPDASEASNR
jgi:hypothetical protein